MSPREQAVLDALRVDRDESGPGLSKMMVEEIGETRFADGLIGRLRRERYVIGVVGGLYQLGEEPDVERAIDTEASPTTADESVFRSFYARSSVNSSLDATPTLFEVGPVSAIDPMLDEAA